MSRVIQIVGVLAVIAQLATPWVITPAILAALIFLILFLVSRFERSFEFEAQLKVAKEALQKVYSSEEQTKKLEEKISEHASKLNAINLSLGIR